MIPKLKSRHDIDVPYQWARTPGVVGVILAFTGLVLALTTLGALGLLATTHLIVLLIGVGTLIVGFVGLTWAATRHEARTGLRPSTIPRR